MRASTRPKPDVLRAREQAIGAQVLEMAQPATEYDVLKAITADREGRWSQLLPDLGIPEALKAWAFRMADAHGPKVRVWRNTLDWMLALMVVRYGEAESHWPDAFTDDDVRRALLWEAGDTPNGVTYITVKDNN